MLSHLQATQGQVADDSEEAADGVVLVKKPVDNVHEFYFGAYVHTVKVCHIVHTATARTQMTFSGAMCLRLSALQHKQLEQRQQAVDLP